jgi:hypothetical protein
MRQLVSIPLSPIPAIGTVEQALKQRLIPLYPALSTVHSLHVPVSQPWNHPTPIRPPSDPHLTLTPDTLIPSLC